MSFKAKLAAFITIFFWASAFVAIRAALPGYSAGALALMRFLVASICMYFIYSNRKHTRSVAPRDYKFIFITGAIGIAGYHIALNYGEIFIPAGIASFIISQIPLVTLLLSLIYLGERMKVRGMLGMLVSIIGIALIASSENGHIQYYLSLFYIILSVIFGGIYSVMQKALLKKYNVIDITAYVIWSSLLVLWVFTPQLIHDIQHASLSQTLSAIYLGIFPGAIAYLTWSYLLTEIPASRAATFLYFAPILSTLLGWVWLGEVPAMISLFGGLVALLGVWMVNQSYNKRRSP